MYIYMYIYIIYIKTKIKSLNLTEDNSQKLKRAYSEVRELIKFNFCYQNKIRISLRTVSFVIYTTKQVQLRKCGNIKWMAT